MKKILALMLVLVMALSLAACGEKEPAPSGSGTSDPGSSQQTPSDTPDDKGGDAENYAWPTEVSSIKWTGEGKVVGIREVSGSDKGELWIYIDSATLEEVGAYIEMLKGRGISYHGEGSEPALAFEDGEFYWAGQANFLRITLYEEPETTGGVDGTYQLEIDVYTEIKY